MTRSKLAQPRAQWRARGSTGVDWLLAVTAAEATAVAATAAMAVAVAATAVAAAAPPLAAISALSAAKCQGNAARPLLLPLLLFLLLAAATE